MIIYGMGSLPCKTFMQGILDGVHQQLPRGKVLEKFVFMKDCCLFNFGSTGRFPRICREFNGLPTRNNRLKVTYDLQTVNMTVVHHSHCPAPGNHPKTGKPPSSVFQYVDNSVARGEVMGLTGSKQDKHHLTPCFHIVYNVSLNKLYQDKKGTFVEYGEENSKTGRCSIRLN